MTRKLFSTAVIIFLSSFFFGCGAGDKSSSEKYTDTSLITSSYDYSISITPTTSKLIAASAGGVIETNGASLSVPAGALKNDTTITAGIVNNPPPIKSFNFVGTPLNFGPSGTIFSSPAILKIPFTQADLDHAGVTSKNYLKLYTFDDATKVWSEVKNISIDTANNIVVGQLNHFSFYALVGLGPAPPTDLGKPQPGDLLYCTTLFPHTTISGWYPGHVGGFTGEKVYIGDGKNASADVVRCGRYNVIEVLWNGVQYSYYDLPGVTQSCAVTTRFEGYGDFMGFREPMYFTSTLKQRLDMVALWESHTGKLYVQGKTFGAMFGMLEGAYVKGPDEFNCLGMIEGDFERVGANVMQESPQGLIPFDDGDIITPAMQYIYTKPATGIVPVVNVPIIQPRSGGWGEVAP